MQPTIDFYFDFSSPYGYLAATQIEALAARHQRLVVWRPFLLGAVFKITGRQPLIAQPLIGDYARRDIARSARALHVLCQLPDKFPTMSVKACRAYYWLSDQDPATAVEFCKRVYHAYFADNRDIADQAVLLDLAQALGVVEQQLSAALTAVEIKQRLRNETESAIARGVFGSPFMMVDDEPFWGFDHFDQLEQWLARGGW